VIKGDASQGNNEILPPRLVTSYMNLYTASDGETNAYSFLPTVGTVANFDGDINEFLHVIILQSLFVEIEPIESTVPHEE
jgi:hypothetical protein